MKKPGSHLIYLICISLMEGISSIISLIFAKSILSVILFIIFLCVSIRIAGLRSVDYLLRTVGLYYSRGEKMDIKRKKELLEMYKNRHPEMGVISYRCKETGEAFLSISKDTRADFNSTNMKLSSNYHPNKRLQELWNQYGPEGFERSVIKVLKYDDPNEDQTTKLENLREQCLASDPNARRMWR